jgi:hypothetical protein
VNNDEYEDTMICCIRTTIRDGVGRAMTHMLDKVKHVKPMPPKPYGGKDNVQLFETWVADLLHWFRVTGITSDSKDQLCIDLCGTNLTANAATWFHTEVEASRQVRLDI